MRHQRAQAGDALGDGGADDGAEGREPERSTRRRPTRPPCAATSSCQRPPSASGRSWSSAAPGLEVRTRAKRPRPPAVGRLEEGRDSVAAERRVDRERVDRRAQEGLGVGAAGDVDVAALGVGDHEQAGVGARPRRRARRPPTRRCRSARRRRAGAWRPRRPARRRRSPGGRTRARPRRRPGTRRRVGVEAEHHLAGARLHGGGEPRAEARRRGLTAAPPARPAGSAVARRVVTTTAPARTSERRPERAPITSDIMAVGMAAMMTTVWRTSPASPSARRQAEPDERRDPEAHDRRVTDLPPEPAQAAELDHQAGVEHRERQRRGAEQLQRPLHERRAGPRRPRN